jgi:hypothetical protein
MPERYPPGLPTLHATAACTGEDTLLQNGASRVRPRLIMEGSPVCSRSPAAGYPRRAAASGAGAHARTCHIATYEPGSGPDSEHAAEWPGSSARLVLLLLHDFPDPGKIAPVSVFKSPLGHPEWCCITSLQVWLEHADGPADARGLPTALTGPASRRGRQP